VTSPEKARWLGAALTILKSYFRSVAAAQKSTSRRGIFENEESQQDCPVPSILEKFEKFLFKIVYVQNVILLANLLRKKTFLYEVQKSFPILLTLKAFTATTIDQSHAF